MNMLAESVNNRRETDTTNETGINETGPGVNDLNQHSTNIYQASPMSLALS